MTDATPKPYEMAYIKRKDKEVLVIALEDLPPAFRQAMENFPTHTWSALMAPLVRDRLAREIIKISIALDYVWRNSNDRTGGGDGALLNISDAVSDEEAGLISNIMKEVRDRARDLALAVQDVARMGRSDGAWNYMRKFFPPGWAPSERQLPRRTLFVNQRRGKPEPAPAPKPGVTDAA